LLINEYGKARVITVGGKKAEYQNPPALPGGRCTAQLLVVLPPFDRASLSLSLAVNLVPLSG